MKNSLDHNTDTFEQLLDQTKNLILQKFEGIETAKAFSGYTPKEVRGWFDEPLPVEGMDVSALLERVQDQVLDPATMNMGPHMYAYVMAGGTQVSILAEMLANTVNQNVGKWHLAPVMSELERRVVQWGADLIGYGEAVGGVLVSGGSAANLTSLTVARNIFFEKEGIRKHGVFGMKPFTVYASDEVHGCVDKSMELLGLGTDHLRKIKTHTDCTIDLQALEQQIQEDMTNGYTPFCLIANAGTVNTGAIDPMVEMAAIAEKYQVWFHVDGAYGGLAAGTEMAKGLFKGIELADSVAVDFHKWLYQPFEAGCAIVKDWNILNRTYYKKASYLSTDMKDDGRFNFNEHHFVLSRSTKALKIWMSLKAYGSKRLMEMVEKDIRLTKYLATQVDQSADFELCNDPELGIVCFRYLGNKAEMAANEEIDRMNREIIPALEDDGRVFITGTTLHNRPVIRACLINHRKQQHHVDFLLKVIREVGREMI